MKARTHGRSALTSLTALTFSTALAACVTGATDPAARSSGQAVSTGAPASARPDLHEFGAVHANRRVCSPGESGVTCFARGQTDEQGNLLFGDTPGPNGGFGAPDLARAYSIPTSIQSTRTIAIVDKNDDPEAENDLAVYRSYFGLPPCTTANGCFKKIMVPSGSPATNPQPDPSWSFEISIDLDMASAGCPSCKIILVEDDDTFAGIDAAVNAGANVVSLSWGEPDTVASARTMDAHFTSHPGVAFFVATGDSRYLNQGSCDGSASCNAPNYPASSPYVTAVGGTSLFEIPAEPGASNRPSRFWSEIAWAGGGAGCSTVEPKPYWQTDTGCSGRTVADLSAVADTGTAVAIYDTWTESFSNPGGWGSAGGTSVSAPLVAAIYAQTRIGNPSTVFWYEEAGSWLQDVTTGSDGSCGGTYLCSAESGYDGPTGLGTPNGAHMGNSPEVNGVSPSAGAYLARTTVTITGSGFSTYPGFTHVTAGGVAATNVSCSSSTQCTATLPTGGIGTTDVVVSVGGHASPLGSQDQFTYNALRIRP